MSSSGLSAAEAQQRVAMRQEKTRLLERQSAEAAKFQAEARAASAAKIERLRAMRLAHEATQPEVVAKPKRARKPAGMTPARSAPLAAGVIPSEPD